MKLLADLYDYEYKMNGFNQIRSTTRAIVLNENNEIAMLHIVGEDDFGIRNHYETPGGGVELNESNEEAIKRELVEELGIEVEIISEIGMVINRFNLLKRITISRYYVCRPIHDVPTNRTQMEKDLIESVQWKSAQEWCEILKKGESAVDRLVHERELTVFKTYLNEIQ